MKILNKYRFIKGGATPVARLVPPAVGQSDLLKSMSITSILDALCEGPIYGLVDQFGKKVYGLDMLKGVYLNKIPVMNALGEYNFRSILMEINLGTENQQSLANFREVHIYRPANFKLLGKILPSDADDRPASKFEADAKGIKQVSFTNWAKGTNSGWPDNPQDPFIFVHQIKNKDVKKLSISFIVEQLYDTVSEGISASDPGSLGTQKSTSVDLFLRWGLEGSGTFASRIWTIYGTVTSPYACMYGGGSTAVFSRTSQDFSNLTLPQQAQIAISKASALASPPVGRFIQNMAAAGVLSRSTTSATQIVEQNFPLG